MDHCHPLYFSGNNRSLLNAIFHREQYNEDSPLIILRRCVARFHYTASRHQSLQILSTGCVSSSPPTGTNPKWCSDEYPSIPYHFPTNILSSESFSTHCSFLNYLLMILHLLLSNSSQSLFFSTA